MVIKIHRWKCYNEGESSRTGRGGSVGSWRNLVRSWHKRILRNGQYHYKSSMEAAFSARARAFVHPESKKTSYEVKTIG